MGGQPNPKEPFDLSQLRERTLAVLRQIPSVIGRTLVAISPIGLIRAMSATASVMQRRFTAQVMMWLCSTFFLAIGLAGIVGDGMPKKVFLILVAYVIWCIVNGITHAVQQSDYRSYRAIYMVMMDMSIAIGVATLGLVLFMGLAGTLMSAGIWAVVATMLTFATLATQFEKGNITDIA